MVSGFGHPDLVDAVRAEGWDLDLSRTRLITTGWENVVLEIGDDWIARFPRKDGAGFFREVALLRRVAGRLPAQTPRVEFLGMYSRFMVYRKLKGVEVASSDYGVASGAQRSNLAASLADFLAAMHGEISVPEATDLGVGAWDAFESIRKVIDHLDEFPPEVRPQVAQLAAGFERRWISGHPPGPLVTMHNDYHLQNMVVDDDWRLLGVWDFSCVEIGRPTFDVRYFDWQPPDLLRSDGCRSSTSDEPVTRSTSPQLRSPPASRRSATVSRQAEHRISEKRSHVGPQSGLPEDATPKPSVRALDDQ